MGRLIGLLLLLNGVILVAGLSMEHVRAQPAKLVDFNADKVRLLERVERPVVVPVVSSDTAPAAPASAPEPTMRAATVATRCWSWPGLDVDLLGEIETRLRAVGIADSHFDLQLEKRLGWWVYLPPFADAGAAQAAIEAAREKGVKDIVAVRGGVMAHAVSLGAFPTLAKARTQLQALRALGVQGAMAGPRPNSGVVRLILADNVPDAGLVGLGKDWGKRAPLACAGN
ncbi:MAG: SPOR domain-containing protein [Pseudomonadota bacterium]|nr:SPOR domain-containing protein [Pseudomonadota bacterium]MDP1902849.1 SPOR domain-containing protein [Pseudomonadota bacterium]MDP2352837.1 SPOR domain-containing protein [Pseudomonadota bacterium]